MTWIDKLVDASFRGVPFKVQSESAGVGRRVQTHEYPNRDKPYTEDLGKVSFKPTIKAYVIGEDCYEQRDRLIEALNKPGPGTLVHPSYGELKMCVAGGVNVSTATEDGRMVRFDLSFVEAGELSYPTSGAATAQNLISSCSALDDSISNAFSEFGMGGLSDFIQNNVLSKANEMLDFVADKMAMVDSYVSQATRLLQGDISVLLPPPSSGKDFIEKVQSVFRAGNRIYGSASDLYTMVKGFAGISLGRDLVPQGIWKTDSKSAQSSKQQSNFIATAIRTVAISEAAKAITRLSAPAPVLTSGETARETGWPAVSHPVLNNVSPAAPVADLPSWDELVEIRDVMNMAIDSELQRITDDTLFLSLCHVKTGVIADIGDRLEQIESTLVRTPDEVIPALVLAANWYDNAARERDILRRNRIVHPGFVPVKPLRVPAR